MTASKCRLMTRPCRPPDRPCTQMARGCACSSPTPQRARGSTATSLMAVAGRWVPVRSQPLAWQKPALRHQAFARWFGSMASTACCQAPGCRDEGSRGGRDQGQCRHLHGRCGPLHRRACAVIAQRATRRPADQFAPDVRSAGLWPDTRCRDRPRTGVERIDAGRARPRPKLASAPGSNWC